MVYACEKEKTWIEDIHTQFSERPIPNFYTLLNESVIVDKILKNNDVLVLEDGITIKVIETNGHSSGSLSFLWTEESQLFTGDAIPVVGDIPIYVSAKDSIDTLKKLLYLNDIRGYLPSWDDVYDGETGKEVIRKSLDYLLLIDETVKNIYSNTDTNNVDEIYEKVCNLLNLKHLLQNPLFKKSVFANINEMRG